MGLNDLFIRVLCIGSVLLYSASLSLMTANHPTFSDQIVGRVTSLHDSVSTRFEVRGPSDEFLFLKLTQNLNLVEPLFGIIGGFVQPLRVQLDYDHPKKVLVEASKITIGTAALLAQNQIKHSVIKAWILQNGSSSFLVNPMKVDVAADVLLSLYAGKLALTDPENLLRAEYDNLKNWSDDLFGLAELCNSPWRPTGLIPYCSGPVGVAQQSTASSYSVRKIVGNLIFNEASRFGPSQKLASIRTIVNQVRSTQLETREKMESQMSPGLSDLKVEIENLSKSLYPDLKSSVPLPQNLVAVIKNEKVSSVHGMPFDRSALELSSKVIFETCAVPSVDKLISETTVRTEHILLIENCNGKKINYESFARAGISEFAINNREVRFTYLHRPSLLLAKKMINNFDAIGALAYGPSSRDAKFLGLDQKIYQDDLNAYKVNGPIGAIEWFRAEIPTANESRS